MALSSKQVIQPRKPKVKKNRVLSSQTKQSNKKKKKKKMEKDDYFGGGFLARLAHGFRSQTRLV